MVLKTEEEEEEEEEEEKNHASREQGSGPSEARVGEDTGTDPKTFYSFIAFVSLSLSLSLLFSFFLLCVCVYEEDATTTK